MKQNCTFPETVEYKSCTATIYQQLHRAREGFEVRYCDVDRSMQRLTFPTYSSAKKFAEMVVKKTPQTVNISSPSAAATPPVIRPPSRRIRP